MKRSKAYNAAFEKIDQDKLYAPLEAVRLARETSLTKYAGTVEVALHGQPQRLDRDQPGTQRGTARSPGADLQVSEPAVQRGGRTTQVLDLAELVGAFL